MIPETFFKGAIRITPRPSDEQIVNMNLYLSQRHSQNIQELNFPDTAWMFDNQPIPSKEQAVNQIKNHEFIPEKIKNLPTNLMSAVFFAKEIDTKPTTEIFGYNKTAPNACSLYSDIRVYPDKDCAYIAWCEINNSQAMDEWLMYVCEKLNNHGFETNGTIQCHGKNEWTIQFGNNIHKISRGHFAPPTYEAELEAVLGQIFPTLKKES